MSTSTTNYGFTKMDPGESADVNIWNANLDAIDTQIKAAQDNPHRDWHYERWFVDTNETIAANGTSQINALGTIWTLDEFDGSVGSPITFDAGGPQNRWTINTPGLWRITFHAYFTSIPTGASNGAVITGIFNLSGTWYAVHTESMELFVGTQKVSKTWLMDVRNDGTGDLDQGTVYFFGVSQENISNASIVLEGEPLGPTASMATFELVR